MPPKGRPRKVAAALIEAATSVKSTPKATKASTKGVAPEKTPTRARPRKAASPTSEPSSAEPSPAPESTNPLKRVLSAINPLSSSKRAKRSPTTTPKKSQYFGRAEDSELTDEESSIVGKEESGYEDEDASATLLTGEEDAEPTSDDESPKRRKKATPKKKNGVKAASKGKTGKELWRPSAKVDAEPGQEVFIKLPKAREPGGTPYKNDTIHPNTLLFLKDLKKNNDREWLKFHDADFRQSEKDFDSFIEKLTEKLIEKDETIPELPAKDVKFRIYRDVRFSSDPTPYKPYFSAAWSRTGRKGPYAHYYLQLAPGESMLGGGVWCPDAEPTAKLRRAIDRKSERLKEVLMLPGIRKECLRGCARDETKVVKAFFDANKSNALKTKPKVYYSALTEPLKVTSIKSI